MDFTGFDGKVTITNENLKIEQLTLRDYILDAPPLKEMNLSVKMDAKYELAAGSFILADKLFTIEQKINQLKEKADIEAHHIQNEISYKLILPKNNKTRDFFPKMKIKTVPSMSTEEALAMLISSKKLVN